MNCASIKKNHNLFLIHLKPFQRGDCLYIILYYIISNWKIPLVSMVYTKQFINLVHVSDTWFVSTLFPLCYLISISTPSKLCLATATCNFKCIEITYICLIQNQTFATFDVWTRISLQITGTFLVNRTSKIKKTVVAKSAFKGLINAWHRIIYIRSDSDVRSRSPRWKIWAKYVYWP